MASFTVGAEQLDALFPDLVGFTHRYPDVGVDNVGILGTLLHVVSQRDGAAVLLGDLLAGLDELIVGHVVLGTAGNEVDA